MFFSRLFFAYANVLFVHLRFCAWVFVPLSVSPAVPGFYCVFILLCTSFSFSFWGGFSPAFFFFHQFNCLAFCGLPLIFLLGLQLTLLKLTLCFSSILRLSHSYLFLFFSITTTVVRVLILRISFVNNPVWLVNKKPRGRFSKFRHNGEFKRQ